MSKYNIIDLFSGCGGLLDGFLQTGKSYPVASVEWEKRPAETLVKRLEDKWNIVSQDNVKEVADIDGYWKEFYEIFGFGIDGVDYDADISVQVDIPSLK